MAPQFRIAMISMAASEAVLMMFCLSPLAVAQGPGTPNREAVRDAHAHEVVPVKIDAKPADGFYHPYLLLSPETIAAHAPVVIATPTPPTSDDPDVYLAAAERIARNAEPFVRQLNLPILVPVLPRPPVQVPEGGYINLYIPSLSREALLSKDEKLARMDHQVLAMLDDARDRLQHERKVSIHRQAIFTGFSAGGHFATRMAVLHPERVLAVWAGGVAGHPILPMAEYEGRRLTYPVGVGDLMDITGHSFDAEAFARIAILIVQGSADANSSLPVKGGPSDSYSQEQTQTVVELFGPTALERIEKIRPLYRAAGSAAAFKIYPDAPHQITPEIARDMLLFIGEHARAAIASAKATIE